MLDFITVGIICIILLLFLIAIGVSIAVSFILTGLISSTLLVGFDSSLSLLMQAAYFSIASPTWTCIPLFVLMGAIAAQGGFAHKAYKSFDAISAGIPGSLGVATCFGCAAFGAISGSSLATAAIFGKLAFPEMRLSGYNKSFALGIIASAGTFASMIPPSLGFIIYALFSNTSIGRLFFAGIIPGLITASVYSFSIIYRVKHNKKLIIPPKGNVEPILSLKERVVIFSKGWGVLLVAFIVLGGIYTGIFTPTEAAAAGSIVVLLFGILERKITKLEHISNSLRESANITSMIFLINVGALYYSRVLAITRIPSEITMLINNLTLSPIFILLIIMLIYFILGMIMVPIGILAMTLPIIIPIISNLGYDLIWFGVVVTKLMEIAAVTPPVGLNVYALKGVVSKDISLVDIFAGIYPFVLCDAVVLLLMIIFPQIVLWLPNLLFR